LEEAATVLVKVEFHFGELFPRVGFIVTSLTAKSRAVVRFYNKRGTAEEWIKKGRQAVAMTRLSQIIADRITARESAQPTQKATSRGLRALGTYPHQSVHT